jgi:hypothetical protein
MIALPTVGEAWTSGPWMRQVGTVVDRRLRVTVVPTRGEVRVVGFVNRRQDRYALVEQLGERFRVRIDRFNGVDYRRVAR